MILSGQITPEALRERYVFLDNDFLGTIFADEELLAACIDAIGKGNFLTIDDYTRLEFMRDMYMPEERENRERFLGNELFSALPEIENYKDFHQQVKENAIELSRLYAHNQSGKGKSSRPSTVDLLLAGTLMAYEHSVLITGNKKDFPSCIFDTLGVLNYEQNDGTMRAISCVTFSQTKFDTCREAYSRIRR